VIIGGLNKEKLEFYLVKKPQFELISMKRVLKRVKKLIGDVFGFIDFLLPLTKEKSLYNMAFTENIEIGGVV